MVQTLATWLTQNDPDQGGDRKSTPNRFVRTRELALYEQRKREVQNARIALMKTGLRAESVNLKTLPGDIAGMVDATGMTVDPVIFRDLEFATQTLAHEQAHVNGITSESLAELSATLKSGSMVAPEYKDAVADLMRVTDVIGLKTAIDLYEQGAYTWMLQIFAQKSEKHGIDYLDCVRLFEKAFPELKVKVQTH
jgi:hypothetical protein